MVIFDILKILISDSIFAMIMPGIFLGALLLIASIFMPSFFPQYKLPMQAIGAVLILFFVFQGGRYHEHVAQKEKDLTNEVALQFYRAEANEVSYKTVTEFITQTKVIEKIRDVPITIYVPHEADVKCPVETIAPNVRHLIDSAAKGVQP